MTTVNACRECGQTIPVANMRVSIRGMYDMHLFTLFEAPTVDGIIEAWREHNSTPQPAIVGGQEVEDMGKATLNPVHVLATNLLTGKAFELRRVGEMVHPGSPREDEQLGKWREAVLADPAIPALLQQQYK